jgi:TolA-binding protein
MLSGIYKAQSPRFHAATGWRGLCASLLLAFTSLLQAAEFGALTIESAPGQPLLAQWPLNHVQPDTDISCFSLSPLSKPSSADSNPVHLEYTTLGSQQGVLMLWSDAAVTSPLTLTLTDRCQHTRQTLTIQPDNTVSIVIAATATPPASNVVAEPAVITPPAAAEIPPPAPPAIPVEAYTALQAQINDLQQNFKQLQTKSDVLYASNLAQADILTPLKTQLIQLQNENHLLRTLVIALGLALIASGFFFADWLRRHAAVPKVIKSRRASKHNEASSISTEGASGPATRPLSGKPFSATVLPTQQASDTHGLNTPTQPPTPTKTSSRLKSVPMHANDDTVMPHGVPQKLSSQQSTQTVMQDASRLFTHGRVNQAIDHLQQHLAKHPKSSPWMWLYLLDLLSKEGKQQEFDIVAGECRKHFNLNVEHAPDLKQQGIESFPRVMKALQQAWGTPQVIALIDDLVYNTRLVPRMGFERSVFEDLMLLKEIACQTQNLPTVPPAPKTADHEEPINGNLRELQQLSEDLYILAPVEHTPFQYWTDFTFELDEPSTLRKSA